MPTPTTTTRATAVEGKHQYDTFGARCRYRLPCCPTPRLPPSEDRGTRCPTSTAARPASSKISHQHITSTYHTKISHQDITSRYYTKISHLDFPKNSPSESSDNQGRASLDEKVVTEWAQSRWKYLLCRCAEYISCHGAHACFGAKLRTCAGPSTHSIHDPLVAPYPPCRKIYTVPHR